MLDKNHVSLLKEYYIDHYWCGIDDFLNKITSNPKDKSIRDVYRQLYFSTFEEACQFFDITNEDIEKFLISNI